METSAHARICAALIAVLASAALVAQAVDVALNNPDMTIAAVIWRLLRFFTILTNGIVAALCLRIAVDRKTPKPRWLGGVTLWIAITGVVYHLLLAATDGPNVGWGWWGNAGLHTAVPAAMLLWWLAFAPRRGLTVGAAVLWLSWPLLYCAYALVRGQFNGNYPYFFLDPVKTGWPGVATWIAILGAAFFAGGLILIGIGRLIRNR
ncbi:Pr6Pr family membrane protein [Pseudooceanicola sp. C21-150M6]